MYSEQYLASLRSTFVPLFMDVIEPEDANASQILSAASSGNAEATAKLFQMVYGQLRQAAERAMANEHVGHTLQATAVVNEVFVRLLGDRSIHWANRAHFYDAAARAMRHLLIDHARRKQAEKRGGGRQHAPLTDLAAAFETNSDQILALEDALVRLETEDPEAMAVVRLRFFAGLSVDDAAAALECSPRKIDMLWARGRARLRREL